MEEDVVMLLVEATMQTGKVHQEVTPEKLPVLLLLLAKVKVRLDKEKVTVMGREKEKLVLRCLL